MPRLALLLATWLAAVARSDLGDSVITTEEVERAQRVWADGVIEIGALYLSKQDYKKEAAKFVDKVYAYDGGSGSVLFKPTMAREDPRSHAHHEFRLSREEAISYMVGGSKEFREDTGFALRPWTAIRFENAGIIVRNGTAMAMGDYYFTDRTGAETKVEFSFGYIRDSAHQHLRVVLHHSSFPYQVSPRWFEGKWGSYLVMCLAMLPMFLAVLAMRPAWYPLLKLMGWVDDEKKTDGDLPIYEPFSKCV
mmetsp:Transcript_104/g.174  ORF Transcript_104/g.174 Transcript_104/m.174 type:complete len:250 (+) Transcript_104:111-860(+)